MSTGRKVKVISLKWFSLPREKVRRSQRSSYIFLGAPIVPIQGTLFGIFSRNLCKTEVSLEFSLPEERNCGSVRSLS